MARVAEVQFHPEATAEFDFAVDSYLEKSEQAARDFLREVDDAITSIATNPQKLGGICPWHTSLRAAAFSVPDRLFTPRNSD
jgi:plasmid stabilization system protein ParE